MKVRPSLRCLPDLGCSRASSTSRFLSNTAYRPAPRRVPLDIPPPFPVTKSCPESCSCPPTPAMPEGLPIDHDQPLNGTMAAYAQQLLICTGQRDWTSRIEDDGKEQGWGEITRGLKRLMGRGGRYADVSCFFIPSMRLAGSCIDAELGLTISSHLTTSWSAIPPSLHPQHQVAARPRRRPFYFLPSSISHLSPLTWRSRRTQGPIFRHLSVPFSSLGN